MHLFCLCKILVGEEEHMIMKIMSNNGNKNSEKYLNFYHTEIELNQNYCNSGKETYHPM